MNWKEYIAVEPDICHGKACFRGTRIMVSVVLDCLAADMPAESIIKAYPSLTKPAIQAAMIYSSELVQRRIITV